jgi:hypothetical protein
MFTDNTLTPIADDAPYTGSDGAKYPSNFPKSEIPGLHAVVEAPRPADTETEVVTGFVIDETHTQVWRTRSISPEEISDDLKNRAQEALYRSDTTALRCLKAGVAFPVDWQDYVIALRTIVQTGVGPLPVQPSYPTGT